MVASLAERTRETTVCQVRVAAVVPQPQLRLKKRLNSQLFLQTAELTKSMLLKLFAKSLASVINLLDPDVIVLGGGLSNIERLYANVPALWRAHVFSDVIATRLLRNRHGDASGVRGAACLWEAA